MPCAQCPHCQAASRFDFAADNEAALIHVLRSRQQKFPNASFPASRASVEKWIGPRLRAAGAKISGRQAHKIVLGLIAKGVLVEAPPKTKRHHVEYRVKLED